MMNENDIHDEPVESGEEVSLDDLESVFQPDPKITLEQFFDRAKEVLFAMLADYTDSTGDYELHTESEWLEQLDNGLSNLD